MKFKPEDFPNLNAANHRGDGPAADDANYNCIAWGAGYDDSIWDPFPKDAEEDFYWPEGVPRDYEVTSLILAYQTEGFVVCTNGMLEAGIEKVAIYADGPEYMHAARQLENGKWTSKMGQAGERIEHDTPEALVGPAFGKIAAYMQRPRAEANARK